MPLEQHGLRRMHRKPIRPTLMAVSAREPGSPLLFATVRYLHELLPLSRWRDTTAKSCDVERPIPARSRVGDTQTQQLAPIRYEPFRRLADPALPIDRDPLRLTSMQPKQRAEPGAAKEPSDV